MPPQYIKPYVKRGKNDAIDAEAICEAMSRPTMRFVPVKTAESQAALTMLGVRDLLVKQRTMLINAMRGHARSSAWRQGAAKVASCCSGWREACRRWRARCVSLAAARAQSLPLETADGRSRPERRLLATIPGIGPIGA